MTSVFRGDVPLADDEQEDFGRDDDGSDDDSGDISFAADGGAVTVPLTTAVLNDEQLRLLEQNVDPLADDGNQGITIYERALAFSFLLINGHQ